MTDKSSRWSMTVYEDQYGLLTIMPPEIAEWGWQDEVCPTSGKPHRQGYLRTKSQMRFSALKKILPGIHIEVAKNWSALLIYCKKEETRDPSGEQVHQVNNMPSKYTYAAEIAERLSQKPDFKRWSLEQLLDEVRETALIDICDGRSGIEWVIIDPNWKLMWKETGMATIIRASKKTDRQTDKSDSVSVVIDE